MCMSLSNRTERALQLASQHVVAGAEALVLPELSSSHAPHGAIVWVMRAGSRQHVKVDRIGTLYNSLLLHKVPPHSTYRERDPLAHVKTPSSLRALPDCRGESVCVGIAREKV